MGIVLSRAAGFWQAGSLESSRNRRIRVESVRMDAVSSTHLSLPGRRQGKVRDMYDLPPASPGGDARLLIVATDRISAFDVVMPTPIPGKGRLLTTVSYMWFGLIRASSIAPTHILDDSLSSLTMLGETDRRMLAGRSMIVRRCRMIPVECVVRGYLDGSGWVDYQRTGRVCGVELPPGLRRGDRLPQPVFTPATKEAVGVHDENIDFERACAAVGGDTMRKVRDMSLSIYAAAHAYADERGMILADTKFEFGFPESPRSATEAATPMLADEVLTPDSSRYWEKSRWNPGAEQASYDKQYLRDYLNQLVAQGRWNKQAPGPELPAEVVQGTLDRYEEAIRRLCPADESAHSRRLDTKSPVGARAD